MLFDRGITFADFSAALDEPRFYFDTDHLNRAGVSELFTRYLKAMLINNGTSSASALTRL
jgi:hypothetical protein